MEDALKNLDKLTQKEALMAIAEVLKATHAGDERMMRVANTVAAIDKRVADVDDRVTGVGDQVARTAHVIEDWVRGAREQELVVNDRVASIDDPVAEVIDGAHIISVRPNKCLTGATQTEAHWQQTKSRNKLPMM